ncbi:MAG: cell envelope integrity protein TolA [Chlorobiaceae bacterium]|nr:cell envelope integrity protein TolA [Chlorobiaceae bacterium]
MWIAAAAAMHLLVFCLTLALIIWESARHVRTRVVNVTFVSLPGSGGAGEMSEPGEQAAAEKPVTEKKEQTKTQPDEQVAEAAKKKVPDEPQKTKPSDLTSAIERLKQNVDRKNPQSPSSLNNALAALKQKVGSQGAAGGTGQGSGSGRGGMGSGFGNGGIADPYKAQLAMIITRNWEFSKAMTRSSAGMEVYVRIDILPDGTIREIVYDRRAPSEYLNMSVKRALEKSSPFPALPKDKGNPDLWVGFVFTPEGIER